MQELESAQVQCNCDVLHLEIVVPHTLDERTDLQREMQAVLRLYQRMRAERIRRSH
jgi:hypothetical protein